MRDDAGQTLRRNAALLTDQGRDFLARTEEVVAESNRALA